MQISPKQHAPITLGTANGLVLSVQQLSLPTSASPTFAGLTFSEVSTPSTPSSNSGIIYVQDDGSGDSALFFLSDSGLATQLGGGGGGGGATTLPGLTDVDNALAYTSGFVLQADGAQYIGAVLAHSVLSGIGTNTHATIDTHIDSATTVHTAATNLVFVTGNQTVAGIKTFSSFPITPSSSPTTDYQVANKQYVDTLVTTGSRFVGNVRAATTAALAANTYANGASGVGATLTANANGAIAAQDGITLILNDRLMVKNEATTANNGVYYVSQVGTGGTPYILTRVTDYDTSSEIVTGTFFTITEGTTQALQQWAMTTTGTITVGTTTIVFSQLSAPPTLTASLGVQKVSNDFRADLSASGAITLTSNSMQVAVDNSSIERSANALQVKALGVTNAMLAGSIADSKLSQITTASKVSGAALTSFSSIPSGAGVVPAVNLGSGTPDTTTFLRGDSSWAVPAGTGAGIVALTYSKSQDTSITTATISNSAVETTLYSYSVPANTLSTNKILRIVVSGTYLNNSGSNKTVTIRLKYGATTLTSVATGNIATSATTGTFTYTFYLMAHGATNVQQAYFTGLHETGTAVQITATDAGTSAIDSTAIQTLVVTAQLSAATATQTLTKRFATINIDNASDNVGAPTDASYVTLAANGNLSNERVLTGTANQITITDNGAGSTVVLATPQNIATGSSPTFVGLTLSGAIATATTIAASTSITSPIFQSNNADVADTGVIRLGNAETIAWEASPASTDVTITVDSSERFVVSAAISATTGYTIAGVAATGTILRGNGTNFIASTATIPDTFAISTIPYASSANVLSALATANYAMYNTGSGGVPVITATPTVSTSLTIGVAAVATGALKLAGTTSGTITLTVGAAAGTNTITLPATTGNVYVSSGTDVAVADGGTNKSSWTQYSIPYASTTTVISEIAIGAANQVLAVNATTNGYTWVAQTAAVSATYVTLSTDASLTQERVLTGTANQVVITDNGAGSTVVLSLPQSIATSSAVTFGGLTLGGNVSFSTGAARTITLAQEASSTDGDALSITAGAAGTGAGPNTGGAINLTGGTGGPTLGSGGALNITGGNANGVATGGAVNIYGGTGFTQGSVNIYANAGYGNGYVNIGIAGTGMVLGTPMTLNFGGASISAVASTIGWYKVDNTTFDANSGWVMGRAGSILGTRLSHDYVYTKTGAMTDGSFRIYKNGAAVITISLGNATAADQEKYEDYAVGTYTFVAGDEISMGIETVGGTGYDQVQSNIAFAWIKFCETA